MITDRARLQRVHELRLQEHWGKRADVSKWPADEKEWRAVDHGSPHDTNVSMARFHLSLAQKIKDAGLLT